MSIRVDNSKQEICLALEGVVTVQDILLLLQRLIANTDYSLTMDLDKIDSIDTAALEILRQACDTMNKYGALVYFDAPARWAN